MQILIFVVTMLMLLSLITYGRIESFRGFAMIQAEFKHYMEKTERRYYNEETVKRYQKTPATTKDQSETKDQEQNPASTKLSFRLFVDKAARDENPGKLEQQINLARNLIYYLYGSQPFYREIEEERPDLLNEIILALIRETEDPATPFDLGSAKGLANIDLGNFYLNKALTKMLKGSARRNWRTETESFNPREGYYSLLDFITLKKNKLKIRVYLAYPQVLMAVYKNPALVQEILTERERLYRLVESGAMDPKEATEEFKGIFEGDSPFPVGDETLDYGVSKTNPRKYK